MKWAVTRVTLSNKSAESTASEVAAAFRGITLPLSALGLSVVLLTEPVMVSRHKIRPMVVFVLFAYAVRLVVALYTSKHDLSSFRLLLALGHVFRTFTSFLSVVHIVLHRQSVHDVVSRIRTIFNDYLASHVLKLARFTKLLAAFCVVCGIGLWSTLLMNAFGARRNSYPYQHLNDGNSSKEEGIRVVLFLIDTSLLSLSKTMSSFTITLFIALCYMLSRCTFRFMSVLQSTTAKEDSSVSQTGAVRDMLLRLSRTSDAVSALNHTYGAMVSWWYADLTAAFLFCIPSFILAASGGAQFSEYAFALVDIMRDMTIFMTMTFVASEMAKNVSDSLQYVLRVINRIEDRKMDINFTLLVKNLVCHIEDAKVELSGAEFFRVDRALMNRVLLLVSTFAIILYQFLS